ncbi:uncharacterized protein VTP21DRAFT_11110 [Calcarisporiella thermophila]|uniref:uncharacterized protein n=1 Tax=Calcarisporiella thermophila TaxID=911321 RepID=UPI003743021B
MSSLQIQRVFSQRLHTILLASFLVVVILRRRARQKFLNPYPRISYVRNIIMNIFSRLLLSRMDTITYPIHISPKTFGNDRYDYIIIGGGTAGCVLANRLSVDPRVKVLVLEAGPSDHNVAFSRMPVSMERMWGTTVDWNILTTPQPQLDNRKMVWPRGKLLGGSSSINAMVCTRCAAADYDEWETLGNPGWSFKDLYPYFKRIETIHPSRNKAFPLDVKAHGTDGEVDVTYPTYTGVLTYDFIDSCKRENLGPIIDFNNSEGNLIGAGRFQALLYNGERVSSSSAFISPQVLRERPNLTVAIGAHVTRILFDEQGGEQPRAIGVEFKKHVNGKVHKVYANREVILSAGAIHSPHILLLSGIGEESHLRQHGIRPVANLPGVGKNLLDHLLCSLNYVTQKGNSIHTFFPNVVSELKKWSRHRSGMATSHVAEAAAFWKHDLPNEPGNSAYSGPNLEAIAINALLGCNSPIKQTTTGIADFYTRDFFSLCGILLKPYSSGSVSLASANPFDMPVVDANYLSDPRDWELMIEVVRKCKRIGDDMRLSGRILYDYCVPRIEQGETEEEALRRHIRLQSQTVFHPTSTCKMGPDSDPMAVVDAELRVRGVRGLRVVDCSVFPTIPAGHTCVPAMAVAERASDIILGASRA